MAPADGGGRLDTGRSVSAALRGGLSCREIREADLPALAVLLQEGFPKRTASYWRDGLRRLATLEPPPDLPRFGHVLVAGGALVGVILLIHAPSRDGAATRCNISSWYVRPAYQSYAALLNQRAVRGNPGLTYLNVSPAPHTRPIIEALGFAQTAAGIYACMPALAPGRPGARVHFVSGSPPDTARVSSAETRLLADHAGFGCLAFWVEAPDGGHPFIFRRRMLRVGLPCAMLIHCPSLPLLERFARPLGLALARRGLPVLLAGSDRPLASIPGRLFQDKLAIYAKGPGKPVGHDLGYTETALFGM